MLFSIIQIGPEILNNTTNIASQPSTGYDVLQGAVALLVGFLIFLDLDSISGLSSSLTRQKKESQSIVMIRRPGFYLSWLLQQSSPLYVRFWGTQKLWRLQMRGCSRLHSLLFLCFLCPALHLCSCISTISGASSRHGTWIANSSRTRHSTVSKHGLLLIYDTLNHQWI